jgi:hypothetical protein
MDLKPTLPALFTVSLICLVPVAGTLAVGSAAPPVTGKAGDTRPQAADAAPLPTLFLSWHAPYGMPRASETLPIGPGALHPDTLWLTAVTGRSARQFFGFDAKLRFRDPSGDSLGNYWRFGGGFSNPHNVRVEFTDSRWPTPSPYSSPGFGGTRYSRDAAGAVLDMTYAVPSDSATAVGADTPYALARVVFPSPEDAASYARPICIHWADCGLSLSLVGPTLHPGPGGERYVGWGVRPGRDPCTTLRSSTTPAPWHPPTDPVRH